ncbi:MAG TPA: hypothetical protein VLX92_32800, partial [Kofleriaceae bacterium]|nr:hypothetical protein [Kofleriaceae bacterium]
LALPLVAACTPERAAALRFPGAPVAFDRAASDPRAVAIADQVIAAAGGRERWQALKQVRWSETIRRGGKPIARGEQAWDRWNARAYGRLHHDAGDVVVMRELYGARRSAYVERGGSHLVLVAGDGVQALAIASERFTADTAALCMPLLLEEPGTRLRYLGELQDESRRELDAIRVELDPRDTAHPGEAFELVVDRASHRVALLAIAEAHGKASYQLDGWQDVAGLTFPTVVRDLGDTAVDVVYADLHVGEPDDALYVPPVE